MLHGPLVLASTGKELRAFTGVFGVNGERPFVEAPATFTPDGTAILYSAKAGLVSRDLQTGLEAGMVLPDPADQSLDTIKVTALP